ncbi:glycoside hydrolase family 15 protein [Escherichia albertii]|nr:glycoside hydrolase family 15 protein [Escherichia albertii]
MKRKSVVDIFLTSVLACMLTYTMSSEMTSESVFSHLNEKPSAINKSYLSINPEKYPNYPIYIHADKLKNEIKSSYTQNDLLQLTKITENTRKLALTDKLWGTFILASTFEDDKTAEETHYDAVWLRDSLWGYLALASDENNKDSAKKVLLTLWDYMSTPEQIKRMQDVINNPELINAPNGQMNAVHIRFDSNSSVMADVQEGGKPQLWNHKQNDALGLYLDILIQAVDTGIIKAEDWEKGDRLKSVVLLVAYLDKVCFYRMEDSGAWEEDARLNTSSVALVTSGLERLVTLLARKQSDFATELVKEAKINELDEPLTIDRLNHQIDKGYERIILQLDLGGESPGYLGSDKHYREADAALLNIIYPANLSKINTRRKEQVLKLVKTLAGPYGIKRYEKDNYQSANFWFNNIKTDTDELSHIKRENSFIPSTEAEWFFDSWYAKSAVIVYKETQKDQYLNDAVKFMNRSIAQITGANMIGANGRNVPEMALPESYNYIYLSGSLHEVPSPIIPLNWSKASMTLMLKEFSSVMHDKVDANH